MKYKVILLLIILIHAALLLKVILFPYPELFVYPYLAKNGLLPYKQIFDQHFPSILMLPVNICDFGLRSFQSARFWLIGLVALSHVFLYLLARKVLKSEKYALMANFIYFILALLFEGYILWIDSFLPPILLAGAYFLIKYLEDKKVSTLAVSGFLLGLALFFKQVLFPLFLFTAIYIYWIRRSIKHFLIYLAVGSIPLLFLIYWIYLKGIFSEFFYWTVRFNFEVYANMGRKLPTLSQLARLLIYFTPAIYFAIKNFRKTQKVVVISIFLLFSLFLALSRFEFVHLQPTLPFLAILTAGYLVSPKQKFKALVLPILVLTTLAWFVSFSKNHIGQNAYFFDKETILAASEVGKLTRPDDHIFVFGPQPVIYSLSQRLPSGNVFTISVPWNMFVVQDRILQSIKSDPPKIIIRDSLAEIDGKKVVDFASNINGYISTNYVKIDQIGRNEILIPRR